MTKAKPFMTGGSQAVRLPAEFRFEGSEEVDIRRDPVTGEVVLSKPKRSWDDYFDTLRWPRRVQHECPAGPVIERPREVCHP
jgi:antitoxin VapB